MASRGTKGVGAPFNISCDQGRADDDCARRIDDGARDGRRHFLAISGLGGREAQAKENKSKGLSDRRKRPHCKSG
jgi:hypothetical protein